MKLLNSEVTKSQTDALEGLFSTSIWPKNEEKFYPLVSSSTQRNQGSGASTSKWSGEKAWTPSRPRKGREKTKIPRLDSSSWEKFTVSRPRRNLADLQMKRKQSINSIVQIFLVSWYFTKTYKLKINIWNQISGGWEKPGPIRNNIIWSNSE